MATHSNPCLTPLTPSLPLDSPIQEPIEQLPITPPDSAQPFNEKPRKIDSAVVAKALHVLANERAALAHLEQLYATSSQAQSYFTAAVSQIVRCQQSHGKIVFTGIGKSRLIALKLVATFNSLAIQSVFLHPTDALHGDLGIIKSNDVMLMITFSGKTPELISLLPHLPQHTPLIAITSHLEPSTCAILSPRHRGSGTDGSRNASNVLLPAPIHLSEKDTFGLSAPTTSTTVAMALGDALALTVAERLHAHPGQGPAEVFALYHPGGAIGAAFSSMTDLKAAGDLVRTEPVMRDLAMHVDDVPVTGAQQAVEAITGLDIVTTAVRSTGGWVRVGHRHIIGPRRVQRIISNNDFARTISEIEQGIPSSPDGMITHDENDPLAIEQSDWISIPGSNTVEECRNWIVSMRNKGDGRGRQFLKRGTILGIVDSMNRVSGVVEIEDVVGNGLLP